MNIPNQNLGQTLASGKTVGGGRYILTKQISDHSNTWLAHDEIENKQVVLTFLSAELCQDPRAVEDLRSQIAVVRDLSHPNIANIYELYEAAGEDSFISSEYIEGMNLNALQQMQPGKVFNWTFLSPLLKQIYAGLQYVHENNLVQASLKPSNLMLDRKGQIKLLDAGIAGILNNPIYAGPPRAGAGGLLPYLSPQQIDGNPPAVTDDIYSLGVTIYEFLTGTTPFNTGDILPQIRSSAPQPLEQRLSQLRIINPVPPIVSSLVMSCLSKDFSARPQNLETLATSLEFAEMAPAKPAPAARPAPAAPAYQAPAQPAAAAPAPAAHAPAAPAYTPPPAKKKPVVAIVAIAAVLVIAAVGAVLFLKKGGDPQPVTNTDKPTPQPGAAEETPEQRIAREAREIQEAKARGDKPTPAVIEAPLNAEQEALLRRRVKEAIELGELAKRSRGATARPNGASSTSPNVSPVAMPSPSSSSSEGFVSLFNGEDLTNWKGDPNFWSVSQEAITAQTPANAPANLNTCLIWQGGTVGDFDLRFQFKFKMVKANDQVSAGVVYRGKKRGDWDVWGYECKLSLKGENIGGVHSRERMGLMSFFQKNVVRAGAQGQDKIEPLGDIMRQDEAYKLVKREDWNFCEVSMRGNQITHKINGRVVAELVDENEKKRAASGLLAFELNTGAKPAAYVQFKDIQLKRYTR